MRYSETTGQFYPKVLEYQALPDDIIEITKDDYDLVARRGHGKDFSIVGGRVVIADKPPKTAEEIQAEAEQEIRARYSAMLIEIVRPYGPEERETWFTQEQEAIQFAADDTALCPMIRMMAINRGITVALMAEKIIANAARFREASGQILGLQQAELDALYPGLAEEI